FAVYAQVPTSTLLPYTTLFRSALRTGGAPRGPGKHGPGQLGRGDARAEPASGPAAPRRNRVGRGRRRPRIQDVGRAAARHAGAGDRKSTRLNSSHRTTS